MTKIKEKLLDERMAIKKRLRQLDRDIAALICEMYDNPEQAYENIVKASKGAGNIEGGVDKLQNSAHFLGKVKGGRFGKKNVEARFKFKEDREQVIKLMRVIPYTQRELESVDKDLAEIDYFEKKEKVKEPLISPKHPPQKAKEKPEHEVGREAERKVQMQQEQQDRAAVKKEKERPSFSVEQEANLATITPQKVREMREAREGQKQKRSFVEQQPEKELRDTPEQFARQVEKEERLADERAAATQEKTNQVEQGKDRSGDLQAKIKEELQQARARREQERDDDDLER